MKNDDFKKAFHSMKTDDITRKTLLKNIYEKNTHRQKESKFMNYKKISIIAASLVLVIGLFLAKSAFAPNQNDSLAGTPPTNDQLSSESLQIPAGSPMIGDSDAYKENTNMDLETLRENLSYIEIKNHTADKVFVVIDDESTLNSIINDFKIAKPRTLKDEDYEQIAKSQSIGNSISLNIVYKDGSNAIVRLNTDLDTVYFNDSYHSVTPDLAKLILNNLSTIPNLQDVNRPAQG